jgi:putative pyruvate formate lyase activating enzyme
MNPALMEYARILAGKRQPRFKALDLTDRIARARALLSECVLCSRECRIDRTAGEEGFCRAGDAMSVSSCFDHHGEEYFFVPSFTVFFNSCTFACQFCQNWEISQIEDAPRYSLVEERDLARLIDRHAYCRNVNFVGGDPTPYLPFILETLSHVTADIPVVWNSNFYMSEISMELLAGVVDVYLSDFKYGNDACARRLSDAENYSAVIRRNHRLAAADAELVIRHLILPNHLECCTKPVLAFIAENLGNRVVVNLMDQYRPCYRAGEFAEINRRITADELESAIDYASERGLNFIT